MIEQFSLPALPDARATAAAVALCFIGLEYLLGRLLHRDTHDLGEAAASFGVTLGRNVVRGIEAGLLAGPFVFAHKHCLLDFPPTDAVTLAALFLATEFAYYWQHRAAHHIRWMWATHAVHHSATRFNLTAAVRVGWTGSLSGNFLFYLPLAWVGFHPVPTGAADATCDIDPPPSHPHYLHCHRGRGSTRRGA